MTSHWHYRVSIQTFDQPSATVTASFAETTGPRDSFSIDGIFGDDIGLVTHSVTPDGSIFAKRRYPLMDPVTADRFTGRWTPPQQDVEIVQAAPNQSTDTSVMLAIELEHGGRPDLVVSDLTRDRSKLIPLSRTHDGPGIDQLQQFFY